jgi:hypothetical protein
VASSAAGQDETAQDAAPQASGTLAVVDLGVVESEDQLRVAVAAAQTVESSRASAYDNGDGDGTGSTVPALASTAGCGEAPAPDSTLLRASATWQGRPATVMVFTDDPGVIVVLASDCSVLALVDR